MVENLADALLSLWNIEGFRNSALKSAIFSGQIDLVKFFLGQGISVSNYILPAARNGHLEIVRLLLDWGADIHDQNDEALQLAVENGHLETVRLLLDRGADIHAMNDRALHLAVENGHLEVVRLLLDQGADIHVMDDYALRRAARDGRLEIVQLLMENGADIHAANDGALRLAAWNGHLKMVQLLMENGADYNGQEIRKSLRKILGVNRLPSSREELVSMLKVAIIHRE